MLTQVDAIDIRGNTLQMLVADSTSGISVENIDGLDPVTAVLSSQAVAQRDGVTVMNTRRDVRNITMELGLNPDYVTNTVASLRSLLYKWFMTKAKVTLLFYYDGVPFATANGYVEDCSSPMFVQDPVMNVSVVCPDPDFVAYSPTVLALTSVTGTAFTEIDYPGTSDAGVLISMPVTTLTSTMTIANFAPDQDSQVMNLSSASLAAGTTFKLDTVPGERAISQIVGGSVLSLLSYADKTYEWVTLREGANQFRITTPTAMSFTLTYSAKYGALDGSLE